MTLTTKFGYAPVLDENDQEVGRTSSNPSELLNTPNPLDEPTFEPIESYKPPELVLEQQSGLPSEPEIEKSKVHPNQFPKPKEVDYAEVPERDDWEKHREESYRSKSIRERLHEVLYIFDGDLSLSSTWKPCCDFARMLQNKNDPTQRRMNPMSCNQRGICPQCGTSYGQKIGHELFDFLSLLLNGCGVEKLRAKSLHFEFTLPKELSEWQASALSSSPNEFRPYLTDLNKAMRSTLEAFFLRVSGSSDGLGIVSNFHFWHSRAKNKSGKQKANYVPYKPLTGHHHHLHVTMPNIRSLGGLDFEALLKDAKVTKDDLEFLRQEWSRQVRSLDHVGQAAKELDISLEDFIPYELNVHYHFAKGFKKLRHYCKYAARHFMQDIVYDKVAFDLNAVSETPMQDDVSVLEFLYSSRSWQNIQTQRRYGFLSNVKAAKLGIKRLKEDSEWEIVGGYYILASATFTDTGMYCPYLNPNGDRVNVFIPSQYCHLSPRPSPRKVVWLKT